MKDLQIFKFQGQQVEILLKKDVNFEFDGDFLIHGSQAATNLGYERGTKAVQDHVDREEKFLVKNSDILKQDFRKLNNAGEIFITESGLYSLSFNSKLESAKKFTKWVKKEVIPTIRKHGMYATDELLDNPDLLIQVATQLKEERLKRIEAEKVNEINKPKVLFADAITTSHSSILVGELAKLIKQNGIDIGEKRLFVWLRSNGYLISRKGSDYNMPTQKSADLGVITFKETPIAHSDGHITVSKPPREKKEERTSLTVEESKVLLEMVSNNHTLRMPVTLALLLGLRRGECLALSWDDIDFKNNTININKTLEYVKGEYYFNTPKTEKSRRTIAIPQSLIPILKEHKRWQNEMHLRSGGTWKNKYNLVCTSKIGGNLMKPTGLSDAFRNFLIKNELPQVRFHDLRHTNASLMLAAGVSAKVAGSRLGHSNISITLDLYSHVLETVDQEAAAKLDTILDNKKVQ